MELHVVGIVRDRSLIDQIQYNCTLVSRMTSSEMVHLVLAAKSVIGGAGGFHARRRVRVDGFAVLTVVSISTRRSP